MFFLQYVRKRPQAGGDRPVSLLIRLITSCNLDPIYIAAINRAGNNYTECRVALEMISNATPIVSGLALPETSFLVVLDGAWMIGEALILLQARIRFI